VNTTLRSEQPAVYLVSPDTAADDAVIAQALAIVSRRVIGQAMDSPSAVKDLLTLKLARLEHEEFACVFLDAQHRVISVESMFRGTLTQTSVYPREMVKRALQLNAGAVIFAHNHPSGFTEPSRADEFLTSTLKSALALVDVRVLDHVVVGSTGCTSFAERGLI
jgi:DNA repair protein RadC